MISTCWSLQLTQVRVWMKYRSTHGGFVIGNNLKLNCAKSKENTLRAREKRGQLTQLRSPCMNIERVSSMKVLGVIINDRMAATDHVHSLLSSFSSMMYAFCVLSHGISAASLHYVFRVTILTKVTYCSPAWAGSCSAADQAKLDNFIRRCKCLGYCSNSVPPISEIFSDADDSLSDSIMTNNNHVLYSYLPERRCLIYHLRERSHNRSLITETTYLN